MRVVAVSELSRYLKSLLDEDYALQDLWVRGEINDFRLAASGHRYFVLKDGTATVRCVLFARVGAHLPPLRNGVAVLAHGRVSLYEGRGDLQFYVDAVEDAGIGELHLRFEALKARLEAEGLFAEARKRALPANPGVVGVVTSSSAAALRDVLRTLRLRCPLVRVVHAPTLVQGPEAPAQIASAMDLLNQHGEAQVILLVRGGGSLEELWAFNEEVVARAIARSAVPVITGVGHETDFTIADFVADLRASTPTAAATLAVPDATRWREDVADRAERLDQAAATMLADRRYALSIAQARLAQAAPAQTLADGRRRVQALGAALDGTMRHLLALRQTQLHGAAARLHALSPLRTLGRGYAVVRRAADGEVLLSAATVRAGDALHVHLADGAFVAVAGAPLAIPTMLPENPSEMRSRRHGT